MKTYALSVLLLAGLASPGVFAAVPGAAPGEAGVREVENGWSKAFVTGDTAYLDALLDPAYVSVGTQGVARPKADIIAMAKAYGAAHPGAQATPLLPTAKIDVKGTAAIVIHSGKGDTSIDVFHYSDGRWRAWYSQHTARLDAQPRTN
ncbi:MULTISPECIES: nuclear transport factor 2 family protein [unclassified Duganella]|uniref:nuclear transport factor 2 family protein n=1 Tax=unclassified Duganella TaxID=2636909 RepID=UPI000E348EF4|nr:MULTISPECIES: nuclear transport factor 2 family protein [unclassified Duganella]